jgi:hypothetical protein
LDNIGCYYDNKRECFLDNIGRYFDNKRVNYDNIGRYYDNKGPHYDNKRLNLDDKGLFLGGGYVEVGELKGFGSINNDSKNQLKRKS